MKKNIRRAFIFCGVTLLMACTFSNDLSRGKYRQEVIRPSASSDMEVAHFYIACRTYARGYDQVPKEVPCNQMYMLSGVGDISVQNEMTRQFNQVQFIYPLKDTHLPAPGDASIKKIIKLDVYEEYGWPRLAFQGILSTLSLTLIPLNYPKHYSISMEIQHLDGTVIRQAKRDFNMDNWWWMPLMFAYPFYNEKQAGENAVLHLARDLAKELEGR